MRSRTTTTPARRRPAGSGTLPYPKVPAGSHRGNLYGLPSTGPRSLLYQLINACPDHINDPSGATVGTCPSSYILDPNASGAYAGLGWRPTTGADAYNFAAENYMVTPNQRVGIFGSADSKLGDVARLYLEGSFVDKQHESALAPEPMWGTVNYTPPVLYSASSMHNPFGVDVDFRRRLVEADRRRETRENDTFRGVAGIDGTLSHLFGPLEGWFWDVSFNYGRDVGSDTFQGNLNLNQVRNALGPSRADPATGTPTCYTDRSFSTPIPGCVPLNLLGAPGSVTADQLAALTFSGPSKGINQQAITQATLQGDLFPIAADRPVALLVGAEYRKYEGSYTPDPFTVYGYTSGLQGAPIAGAYDVKDFFGELSLPLVSGMPFVEDLEASVAARVFKYNLFNTDQVYKLGARWKPAKDVTIRGTFATAYRAPSISELYGGTGISGDTASDPCDDYTHLTQEQISRCIAGGGPPTGGMDSGQTQLVAVFGSPPLTLKPETARTFTAGVVYAPELLKGLSATVDFWNVDITNPITRDGAQFVVNSCILRGVQSACDRITRAADGTFARVEDLLRNQGEDQARGIDVALRYALPTPVGRFGLGLDSTFLLKRDLTTSASTGSAVIKGRGTYDLNNQTLAGGVNPTLKFNASVSYAYEGFLAGIFGRYVGGYKECAGTATGLSFGSDCYHVPDLYHDVPAYMTWDANVGYTVNSSAGKTTAGVGIVNAFDKAPPVVYSNVTQWSDWNYDFLGRRYYFRLVHRH